MTEKSTTLHEYMIVTSQRQGTHTNLQLDPCRQPEGQEWPGIPGLKPPLAIDRRGVPLKMLNQGSKLSCHVPCMKIVSLPKIRPSNYQRQ